MPMIERSLLCLDARGFHRLAYTEWPGPSGAPTLLCVHGLTRNGRDMVSSAHTTKDNDRAVQAFSALIDTLE